MADLLWLAHDRACEAELAQQLDELLAADRLPDLKLLEQRFVAHLNDGVPVVTVDIPGADSYDALFAARGARRMSAPTKVARDARRYRQVAADADRAASADLCDTCGRRSRTGPIA